MPHLLRSIAGLLRVIANLVFTAGFIWAAWVIGLQCFWWLKYSEWQPKPFLFYCGEFISWEWLFFPRDWLGIHQVLNWFNAGMGVLLCSAFIAISICLLAISIEDEALKADFAKQAPQ